MDNSRSQSNPEAGSSLRRDAIARNLCARICDERRSIDELRVLDAVLSGLERGADAYGPLDLATDPRDWEMETAEERRDELVYRSCALLSKRDELLSTSANASSSALVDNPGSGDSVAAGHASARPAASEARGSLVANTGERAARSAVPGTVSPDGSMAGGGTFCQGGETVAAPAIDPPVPNNGRRDTGAPRLVESVGRAGSSPAPDTRPEPGVEALAEMDKAGSERRSLDVTAGETALSAPARHGAQRDAATPFVRRGHETPSGGTFVTDAIEAGLAELKNAPAVDLNSAEMWSAEMVDERFDDGGES